jgi:actin-related protein
LHSQFRKTGTVLSIGHGVTYCSSIIDGIYDKNSTIRLNFGGADVTNYLSKMFTSNGNLFTKSSDLEVVKDIKERLCYCSPNYDEDIKSDDSKFEKNYELANEEKIKIKKERFKAPEVLFKPKNFGLNYPGVHEIVVDSIMKCKKEFHSDLFSNIIMFGGSTMFDGFADRLKKEIVDLSPNDMKIKCVNPFERKYSVWFGASFDCSNDLFKNLWVDKKEYDEFGDSINFKTNF